MALPAPRERPSTIRKTSDKNAYARGQASIPRVEVDEIRIRATKGPGRLIGAAGLGTAAGLSSIGWAISDSLINVDDSTRITQWVGITDWRDRRRVFHRPTHRHEADDHPNRA